MIGLAGATAGCSAAKPTAAGSVSPSQVAVGAQWQMVWHDEFDGKAGAPPDPAHWGYDLGSQMGWGNDEWEYYTNDPANASMDGDGHLAITARKSDGSIDCYYGPCQYTSARLLTKNLFQFKYGLIQARIKVPTGVGLWPAFWMLGSNIDTEGWPGSGEVDVMENVGRTPNTLYGTIHGPGYSGGAGIGGTVQTTAALSDDYHVFGVEWSKEGVKWTLDGKQYFQATPADAAPNDWVFDHDFFILLNLAVGGLFAGLISPDTVFPATMSVDYVRVYQLKS
jgi:beta-glucanase (GH16 family)